MILIMMIIIIIIPLLLLRTNHCDSILSLVLMISNNGSGLDERFIYSLYTNKTNKLRSFSPQANYTDGATATCQRG
jgi:hypothetical protein